MPTYRSINIALHSQFGIETLPEYSREPLDATTSACSVYAPMLSGSNFWISYSVDPPVPAGHYFLFKLHINGSHVVSWSTGAENGWAGKTMFALFDGGQKRVEKRVFCFMPNKDHKATADVSKEAAIFEIKVHRANARKRTERVCEAYEQTPYASNTGARIRLARAGRAGPQQPKRFYQFALIDPVDNPFATFRYYHRDWDQLRGLKVLQQAGRSLSAENDGLLPVIEPQDASPHQLREKIATPDRSRGNTPASTSTSYQPHPILAVEQEAILSPSPASIPANAQPVARTSQGQGSALSLGGLLSSIWRRRAGLSGVDKKGSLG